jgi:hypothetical protein
MKGLGAAGKEWQVAFVLRFKVVLVSSLFELVETGLFSKQSDEPNAWGDYKTTLR